MRWRGAAPWVVTAGVAALFGFTVLFAAFSWYMSEALAFDFQIAPEGTTIMSPSFAPASLVSALVVAVICSTLVAGGAVGLYYLLDRRRAPALTAAIGGPAAVFVVEALGTVSDALGVPRGQEYLGVNPIAIAGRALIVLMPAIVGAVALLLVAHRPPRSVSARSD